MQGPIDEMKYFSTAHHFDPLGLGRKLSIRTQLPHGRILPHIVMFFLVVCPVVEN